MLNSKDLKIDILKLKSPQKWHVQNINKFVKIEHIPSGIIVTKHDLKSQLEARNKCMKELENLVKLWDE